MKVYKTVLYWGARLVAAIIMLQTLYFKFSAAPESVYIFTTIGMEPWGRIAVGALELVASVLLLINTTAWLGAALGFGLMAGAIMMHLVLLGISVQGDGGYLFALALIVTICCTLVMWFNQDRIISLVNRTLQRS